MPPGQGTVMRFSNKSFPRKRRCLISQPAKSAQGFEGFDYLLGASGNEFLDDGGHGET